MPTTKLDDEIKNPHDSEDLLEVKAPLPRQKRRYAWIILALLLLLALAGALIVSAQARFNRDYEAALKLLQQQNVIAATLEAGK